MIEFANELVRTAFHSLSIEKQKEFEQTAERLAHSGFILKICAVNSIDKNIEIVLQIIQFR